MSIKHAILGLLSWKPLSGYDLKKCFEGSSAMHWSGNNNQIYKALLNLSEEGWVESKTLHQEGAPTKKVYRATEQGLLELQRWVQSQPEIPEFKKPFLVQLAWSDLLSDRELHDLLNRYEMELEVGLRMLQEKHRRDQEHPRRTAREHLLWTMMYDSLFTSYHSELDWVMRLRQELMRLNPEPGHEV